MTVLGIMYVLLLVIFSLAIFAVIQIKTAGINVKDFWSFIEANQLLDKLYLTAKKYQRLNVYEQLLFLGDAEKIFNAYDKVPNMLWEEEHEKYNTILDAYRDIRVTRWETA